MRMNILETATMQFGHLFVQLDIDHKDCVAKYKDHKVWSLVSVRGAIVEGGNYTCKPFMFCLTVF